MLQNSLPHRMIVAKVGLVHDGSFGSACALVDAAVAAGASAVKFQVHIATAESIFSARQPATISVENQYRYLERTAFSQSQWCQLRERCESQGAVFMASAFSESAVDLLEQIDVRIHSVPSSELTNLFLLERLAAIAKPIVVSCGMSNWKEVDRALKILVGSPRLILLQSSSLYPCPSERVGLNVIASMRERYGCEVGLSDHTTGLSAGVAAAVLGATMVQKPITFSKAMFGVESKNSMGLAEFRVYCDELKSVWSMLDNPVDKDDLRPYRAAKMEQEKSLVSAHELYRGLVLKREHVLAKRGGGGIPTFELDEMVGKRLKFDLLPDTPISREFLE